MTLLNGLCGKRSVKLWSDSLYVGLGDNADEFYGSKAFAGLDWPFAAAFAAINGNPKQLICDMGNAKPANLLDLLACATTAAENYQGDTIRMLIAAYEERPRLFLISSEQMPLGYSTPFQPVEVDHYADGALAVPAGRMAVKRGYNVKRMRTVAKQLAETPEEPRLGLGMRHWIGGDIQEITVDADGIKVDTIAHYVDGVDVGEMVKG